MHKTKPFPSRIQWTGKAALALLCSALLACEPVTVPDPPETPTPQPSGVEGTPVPIRRVNVQILLRDSANQGIAGAQIKLTSPTQPPENGVSDNSGTVNFPNLRQDTEYAVEVMASNYVPTTRKANLSQLTTQNQNDITLAIVMEAISTSVSGQVFGANGQPLEGASVYDTRQSVLTDASGKFLLTYNTAAGNLNLKIAKSGYNPLTRTLAVQTGQQQDLGQLNLVVNSQPQTIGIDLTHQPLGHSSSQVSALLKGMVSALQAQGYRVELINNNLLDSLNQLDTLLIPSPNTLFSVEESSAIQAFVLSGHKLVVTGEWAGFGGFSNAVANSLLTPMNLQFGADTLRDQNSGFLKISQFETHPLTRGVSSLELYQTGSVRLVNPELAGQIVARSSESTFRIAANTGAFGVVATAPFGSGKAVVVGDTSLWLDEDSDQDQQANLNEASNRNLLEQIMTW